MYDRHHRGRSDGASLPRHSPDRRRLLAGHEKDLAELIEPAPGPVSTKWSDPVAYDIKFPADE